MALQNMSPIETDNQQFHYQISWRSPCFHPGHHKSKQIGGGQELREFAELSRHPDARRIDMRLSLRDPFGNFHVRVFNQRSLVQVYAIADLSASISFTGKARKRDLMIQFCAALARSASQTGDPFGFIGCGSSLENGVFFPATHMRGIAENMMRQLQTHRLDRHGAGGLAEASHLLTGQRKLVFLISDFHLPEEQIESILNSLSKHDVVPIVLWDSGEYEDLPDWGLTRLRDLESGEERTLFLRPLLKERIRQAYLHRKELLYHLFLRHGREPFFLIDKLNADTLTEYFLQRS